MTRAGKGQLINRRDQYIYKNLATILCTEDRAAVCNHPLEDNKGLHPNSHNGQEFDYILSRGDENRGGGA